MSPSADQQERAGDRAAGRALERQREAAADTVLARKQFDLATIPDDEFERGLELIVIRRNRIHRILETALIEGVHYGNPPKKGGGDAFKKPMLYQAGAEELRTLFRLKLRQVGDPLITETDTYVSVTVQMAVEDGAGRLLAPRSASCTSKESRFKATGGGWIYSDAREVLHTCMTIAEKRAGSLSTREACAATQFLAAEDEMAEAMAATVIEPDPWTEEQKQAAYAAAFKVGIKTAEAFAEFVEKTLDRRAIYATDVESLMAAIRNYKPAGVPPVKNADLGGDAEPVAASTPSASIDDAAVDRELASQEKAP